jgi:alginate O-acetyltransferase complex protein AlgI
MTLAMLIGWVFFYFTNLHEALRSLQILFGFGSRPLYTTELGLYFYQNVVLYAIAIIGSTPLPKWLLSRMAQLPLLSRTRWAQVMVPLYNFGVLSVSTVLLVGSTYNPFLYFRF